MLTVATVPTAYATTEIKTEIRMTAEFEAQNAFELASETISMPFGAPEYLYCHAGDIDMAMDIAVLDHDLHITGVDITKSSRRSSLQNYLDRHELRWCTRPAWLYKKYIR